MTLALKSWFEVRRRSRLALLGWVFMVFMFLIGSRGDNEHARAAYAGSALSEVGSLEVVMLMVFGSLLAGSGVTTQSSNAMTARMQDSVLFTLSLPVRRRSAFLTRAALGALAVVPMVLLCWAVVPLMMRFTPAAPPAHLLAEAIPFQLVGVALAYSGKLFVECLVGEMTQMWLVGGAVIAGLVTTGLRWPPMVRFINFASGATYITTGQISWIGIAVCLALSCAFVFAAVHVIERREF